jgi:hypothetical protein
MATHCCFDQKKYDIVHYLKKVCLIQRLAQTLRHVKFKYIGQLVYNKWKVQTSCGGHGKIIKLFIATLALGSRSKQRLARVQAKWECGKV